MPSLDIPTAVILAIGSIAGLVAAHYVRKRWPTEGKWGINKNPVHCPNCQTPAPTTRLPANRRQLLWGGWTCAKCGVEFDKYGKALPDEAPTP